MWQRDTRSARPLRPALALGGLLLAILCAALLLLLVAAILRTQRVRYRGVEYAPPATEIGLPATPWGVNVALEQYDEAKAERALTLIEAAGFRWLRQRFRWDEIEPASGDYRWERWDRLVGWARAHGLELIAVLDGAPAWVRDPADIANPLAPPRDAEEYARWVAAFAAHYRNDIRAYQLGDEPNIWPHSGQRGVDPEGYARLLRAAYPALKAVNPDAWVLSAGLAPTLEESERNLSDLLYLRALYDAGAAPYFDILGAKPYGFWTGPDDRVVSAETLNYSRLILLREEMVRQGDGDKAIWAVELGWNALPRDWAGRPAPWGADSPEKQATRLVGALERARQEWPWLGLLCVQHFQPLAAPDDPVHGFALVEDTLQPRPLYDAAKNAIAALGDQPQAAPRPRTSAVASALTILALGLAIVVWRGVAYFRQLPWLDWWRVGEARFRALSDRQQALLVGLLVALYVLSPRVELAWLLLWLLLVLTYLRLEWTLLIITLSIPFSFYYRDLGFRGFSLAETFTVLAVVAWVLRTLAQSMRKRVEPQRCSEAEPRQERETSKNLGALRVLAERFRGWLDRREPIMRMRRALRAVDWRGLDGAWCFFVLLAIASLAVSRYLGVSIRELRVVVLGSALFYFLLAHGPWPQRREQTRTFALLLADALVLAGTLIALHGLYQYFLGGGTIEAEGVRRIRSFYGSPNNVGLLLGRILPIALALTLRGGRHWRRWAYGASVALLVPCLFLTFSRGAWLLGLPASLGFLGLMRGRRAWRVMVVIGAVGLLLLVPLAGTERIASLLDPSQGTTLFRLSLWKSAIAMIRDHPVTGLGLDNFLYYYPQYILPEAIAEPNLSHPHNVLLDFWLRLGLGGVIALLWFQIAFFRTAFQLCRRFPEGDVRALTLGLMASMVNFLAHGLVDSAYFVVELAFIFAFTLGLTQKLKAMEERRT